MCYNSNSECSDGIPFVYVREKSVMKRLLCLSALVISAALASSVMAQELDEFIYLPMIFKSPSGQVVISGFTHWESYGSLKIVGRIRNETNYNVTYVHFAANLFDSTGRLIDVEDWVYVPLDVFAPGDETCFYASFWNIEGWSYYEFEEVQYWKTTNEPLQNMTIYDDYGYVESPGRYRILGFVRNDNSFVVHSVVTIATLFNNSGNIIGCNGYSVSTSPLDPGQSTSFENYPYWNGEDVASYRLQVDGWY